MKKETKRKAGRPKNLDIGVAGENVVAVTTRIEPSIKELAVQEHGSLANAIRYSVKKD